MWYSTPKDLTSGQTPVFWEWKARGWRWKYFHCRSVGTKIQNCEWLSELWLGSWIVIFSKRKKAEIFFKKLDKYIHIRVHIFSLELNLHSAQQTTV